MSKKQEGKQAYSRKGSEQLHEIAQKAFLNDEVPRLYINGFLNGMGVGDAYLVLQTNGKTIAVVNMPLTTLKTLARSLTIMAQGVEEQLGQEILTIQQFQEKITKK